MIREQAYPYGRPALSGHIKIRPQDFKVTEELGFKPDGQGEHLLLWIEKIDMTTHDLVGQVARDFKIHPRQISYSGLKDKRALTRQWLSLHLPGRRQQVKFPNPDQYSILEFDWHGKKLRHGTHKSNRFEILLREVNDLPDEAERQLQQIRGQGFANYFGAQRFGIKNDNVSRALGLLNKRRLNRSRKSILLSSLRSYLFNRILTRRISLGHWDRPLQGDVFMLRGSRSIFSDPLDDKLLRRYRRLDIAATASLYGAGESLMSGEPQAIETRVFSEHEDITCCLEQQGARLQMRALRAVAGNFSYDYEAANRCLLVKMDLPAGSYATTLLDHFIKLEDSG